MGFQEPLPAPWVHEKAREIVAGLAPKAEEQGWLRSWLDGLDLDPGVGQWVIEHHGVVEVVLYVIAAATVGFLVYLLAREVDLRMRGRPSPVGASVVRERVDALLKRARAERSAGRRLAALRLYFAALVVGLSRRGDLEYHDAWTNRELVARGAHTAELKATLAPLVRELDGLVYGGQEVTEDHLERLEQWCKQVEA